MDEKDKKDLLKIKREKLLFYKNLISNIEVIYENLEILRNQGNNLPIDIKIKVHYDEKDGVDYYLNRKKFNFEKIEKFLINSKIDYLGQLESAYKEKPYIRFLYGKLLTKIEWYLNGENLDNVKDIFRFILNKGNNDDEIKISNIPNPQILDFINQYNEFNKIYFENISKYLIDLFEINTTSLYKHYESILIKDTNKYK